MRNRLWLLFKISFSIALILFLLQRVNIDELKESLAEANSRYIFWAVVVCFAAWAVASYKWLILLKALGKDAHFFTLLSLNFIGLFYSLFLPGQISGEVIKGVKLSKSIQDGTFVLVSIIVDRLTGLLVLILFALGGIIFLTKDYYLLPFLISILVLLLLLGLIFLNRDLSELVGRTGRKILTKGRVRNFLFSFWNILKNYRGKEPQLLLALFWGIFFHALVVAFNYLVCISLNINLSFLALIWIVTMVYLVQLLPISISGIGVREGAYIFLFGQYGISASVAFSFSIIIFSVIIFLGILGGMIELLSSFKKDV